MQQLTNLLEAIETLRNMDWVVKPPVHKGRIRTRIISEAMSSPNQKRSLAAKRMWKRRKKAA
jgi:precorrin-2 methylase